MSATGPSSGADASATTSSSSSSHTDVDSASASGCPLHHYSASATDLATISTALINQVTGLYQDWIKGIKDGGGGLLNSHYNPTEGSGPIPHPAPYALRIFHAKCNALLRAKFHILSNVPIQFQHGLFAKVDQSFDAYIRVSDGNSRAQSDTSADVHGFAIKLVNVLDDKISLSDDDSFAQEQFTQDFLFATGETFFVNSNTEYAGLLTGISSLARSNPLPLVWWIIKSGITGPVSIFKRLNAATQIGGKVENPLHTDYFSQVPYQLGTGDNIQYVRYKLTSVSGVTNPEWFVNDHQTKTTNPINFLRENTARTLSEHEIRFTFSVQVKTEKDELEVQTVAWTGEWHPIAELIIPIQDFDHLDQFQFAEDLSFNPWHSLPAHAPAAAVGLARKQAYLTSSKTRHELNLKKSIEPNGKEVFTGPPYK